MTFALCKSDVEPEIEEMEIEEIEKIEIVEIESRDSSRNKCWINFLQFYKNIFKSLVLLDSTYSSLLVIQLKVF